MCGIAGFLLTTPPTGPFDPLATLHRMTDTLAHRGPDDRGVWFDPTTGMGLGHRRLSIQDLTREGAQPMTSPNGRYRVVFNGEIYNFLDLHKELQELGCGFHGRSDTEVLLAAIETWGLAAAVGRFVGMFALALWDGHEQRLTLVRDRLGVKPLYYGRVGGGWLFASELKAMGHFPGFSPQVDRQVLTRYLELGYVPAPWSIYQGVHKVQAGTMLVLQGDGVASETVYWSARHMAAQARRSPYGGDEEERQARLESLLTDAVGLRMIADAPVGAFLSGGIDSSLVVALMNRHASGPVRTFAIGFHEGAFNEAPHARQVAQYLATDHTEWMVTPQDALAIIPELPRIYDEPFADPSQIPTCLVCRLARQQVTVCLSGDGGDEFFVGYNRYRRLQNLWRGLAWLPPGVRHGMGGWGQRWLSRGELPFHGLGAKGDKVAAGLAATTPEGFYRALFSYWLRASEVVKGGSREPEATNPGLDDFLSRILYRDMVSFLPDDILVKVDRASMDVGLEVRGPLLDHRLATFAWELAHPAKMQGPVGKLPLRQLLYRLVPRPLVDRPKQGFAVPIAQWLRGPLAQWGADLLQEERLQRQGYFNPAPIQRVWQEHQRGGKDWSLALWTVLMFQMWLETKMD